MSQETSRRKGRSRTATVTHNREKPPEMSVIAATQIVPAPGSQVASTEASDRRADVDAKQLRVATFLREVECEGLLLLEPEHFAWLTAGGASRGVLDPAEQPALYFSPEARWVIASNVDSQRLFDEEIDGLGFQLKEWPWHRGRAQLLADLRQGRAVACDQPLPDCKHVAGHLHMLRRALTAYEQACLHALGRLVSHALEATCRNLA